MSTNIPLPVTNATTAQPQQPSGSLSPLQQLIASMQPPAAKQPAQPPASAPGSVFVYSPDMLDSTKVTARLNEYGVPLLEPLPNFYCATPYGAQSMQSWLETQGVQTTITEGYPLFKPVAMDPVAQPQVPMLTDGKGAVVNPAQLIWNFTNLPSFVAARIALQAFSLADTQQ